MTRRIRTQVSAHRPAAAAARRAERLDRPDRRRWFRRLQRLWRPVPDADLRKAGGQRLRYNRFHTCALCAPTRQALMTGRNHHSVGMGNITETATAAPGQCSVRSNTKAPVALTLKLNGYSTAMFGKCHEVPVWENNPMGPFEHSRRWRLRVLLRLRRRREQPVGPRAYRGPPPSSRPRRPKRAIT